MVNVNDITITSLETITAFDVVTGDLAFVLDELQNTSIGHSNDVTDITGKGGRKLSTLKGNKAVTISGTSGLISGGLFETQIGSDFEKTESKVMYTDYLAVESNGATTTYKAVGTAGNEIESVYIRNNDGTLGATFTQGVAVGKNVFTYDPETKALKFNDGEVADGSEIVVYYFRNISAHVLKNESDKFSKKLALYVDAFAEDKCSNVYHVQFYIPKADFSGNFELQMGDNQSTHPFEATALSGACGTKGMFYTYTIFGENTPDA